MRIDFNMCYKLKFFGLLTFYLKNKKKHILN